MLAFVARLHCAAKNCVPAALAGEQNHLSHGSASVSPPPAGLPSMKPHAPLAGSNTSTQLWLPLVALPFHAGVPASRAATPTLRSASTNSSETPVHDA